MTTLRRLVICLFALGARIAGVATAQNLIPNPDFNDVDEIDGWSLLSGSYVDWEVGDRNACADSGLLIVYVTPVSDDERLAPDGIIGLAWSDCIPMPPAVTSLNLRFDWTSNVSATGAIVQFPDSGCADAPVPVAATQAGSAGIWNAFSAQLAVASPAAIRVEVGFSSSSSDQNQIRIDRVFLSFDPPIFFDDFEAAATCRWSDAVGEAFAP